MGDRHERQLVNFVEEHGWAAVRLGASGGGTARNLPDVLMGDGGARYWAVEEKYSGKSKQVYIDAEEAQQLSEFATRFGARPMAAVRYSTRLEDVTEADWFLCPIEKVPRTDAGNLRLNHTVTQEAEWPLLADLV